MNAPAALHVKQVAPFTADEFCPDGSCVDCELVRFSQPAATSWKPEPRPYPANVRLATLCLLGALGWVLCVAFLRWIA